MDLRVLILVPALAGSAIAVALFAAFAAHYYLTVLEGTAAGSREVTWGGESITDAFWKPFYLAWLLGLWLGPAYILGRALAGGTHLPWLTSALPLAVAWLLFPVSQLSSLCASSVWIPLHPQVFARLVQRPGAAAGFLALTLPVFALGGLAFRWSFLTADEWPLLLVGIPLLALSLLLYARLLGRLAFVLMFTKDILKRKKKKLPKTKSTPAATAEPTPEVQPPDLPPVSTPDGELTGYNVLIADEPPAPKKRVVAEVVDEDPPPAARSQSSKRPRAWTEDDEDKTPYEMGPVEVEEKGERVPEAAFKPSAEEMELLDRRAPRPSKRVWGDGLLAFLGQPGTVAAVLALCLFGLAAGAMVRIARQFDPTAGAG